MRYGVKRWITRYIAQRYRCPSCRTTFYPPDRRWTASKYGPDLIAYTMYQNIELRLPQSRIDLSVNKLFGLDISRNTTNRLKGAAAQTYAMHLRQSLEKALQRSLAACRRDQHQRHGREWLCLGSHQHGGGGLFLHADPGRQHHPGDAQEFLGRLGVGFLRGVRCHRLSAAKMSNSFHPGFERRTTEHPYDDGLKQLVGNFAGLVKPMVETVDRRGLKKRFLGKHRNSCRSILQASVDGLVPAKPQASSSIACKRIAIRCLRFWISTMSHGTTIMRSTP